MDKPATTVETVSPQLTQLDLKVLIWALSNGNPSQQSEIVATVERLSTEFTLLLNAFE